MSETTPQQQVVQGTLDDIVQKVEAAQLKSPAVIVVGEVNRLREHLRWFDTKPLFGKRILVTPRPRPSERICRPLGSERRSGYPISYDKDSTY